jgi:hypothetical protein
MGLFSIFWQRAPAAGSSFTINRICVEIMLKQGAEAR